MSIQHALANPFEQALFDMQLSLPQHGLFNRLMFRSIRALLAQLMRGSDRLVRYTLDGVELRLPISHDLPLYRKWYPYYSTNIVRIARNVQHKYPDLSMIDIGANVGDTAAMLRQAAHFPILCVEGNARFADILRMNLPQLGPEVYVEQAFVGEETGTVSGHVMSQHGTAEIIADPLFGSTVLVMSLMEILKSHTRFAQARLIKIDTDGFDLRIVRGALALLSQIKSILFFEFDPAFYTDASAIGRAIFEELHQIGYRDAVFWENTGEYLLTAALSNTPLIEDVGQFYAGRNHLRYCDVCVLHADDHDLAQAIRQSEIQFFRRSATQSLG